MGAVRDHALALACLREGLPPAQARFFDDLSAETLARYGMPTSARSKYVRNSGPLWAASVRALIRKGAETRLPQARVVAERLAELR